MNDMQHSQIWDQKNLEDNQNRREQKLIDERISQKQEIADLKTCMDVWDKM